MLRRDIEIYIASLQRPIDKGGAKGVGRGWLRARCPRWHKGPVTYNARLFISCSTVAFNVSPNPLLGLIAAQNR